MRSHVSQVATRGKRRILLTGRVLQAIFTIVCADWSILQSLAADYLGFANDNVTLRYPAQ
jgi:hypothetical protein